MKDVRFYKLLVLANAVLPSAMTVYYGLSSELGVNPVEFVLRGSGVMGLIFLFISLAITPLRSLFGWNQLIKYRRELGLISFAYICIHLFIYLIFDRSGDIPDVINDIWQRPFIAIGMTAFFAMVPLAATSTDKMVRRLGKRWQKLHYLAYPIAILGVVHFWMIVKSDVFFPMLFAAALTLLLGFRVYKKLSLHPRSRRAI